MEMRVLSFSMEGEGWSRFCVALYVGRSGCVEHFSDFCLGGAFEWLCVNGREARGAV